MAQTEKMLTSKKFQQDISDFGNQKNEVHELKEKIIKFNENEMVF